MGSGFGDDMRPGGHGDCGSEKRRPVFNGHCSCGCGRLLTGAGRGKPQKWATDACRKRAERERLGERDVKGFRVHLITIGRALRFRAAVVHEQDLDLFHAVRPGTWYPASFRVELRGQVERPGASER